MGLGIRRLLVAAGLACLTLLGCGGKTQSKLLHGSVACGGEKAPMGQIMFVPIENTSQPPIAATVVDGQYRMVAGGGVPLGKYRVRVDARKKTGRKVQGNNGLEVTMIDEVVGWVPRLTPAASRR